MSENMLSSVEISLSGRCKHRDRNVNSNFKFVDNYKTVKNHSAMLPASEYL